MVPGAKILLRSVIERFYALRTRREKNNFYLYLIQIDFDKFKLVYGAKVRAPIGFCGKLNDFIHAVRHSLHR